MLRGLRIAGLAGALLTSAVHAETDRQPTLSGIDRIFADYQLDAHVPGLVYGIVANGRLIYVKGIGVQDLEQKRPVTPDTLFRIASMTKVFTALTILHLRDEGKLSLDAAAETYVPELRSWTYPTKDSPRIRVRDLLNHTAGFVTDDPWGDRQQPLPDADFTAMLRAGVPFTRPPQTQMEYSNFGYALLGRIITNVSKRPYRNEIERTLLQPLGMTSSGFEVTDAPAERRALGYRWENNQWALEPTMAHGAFGAMGGLQTSANDYAKFIVWLLAAWPPRDDADAGPIKRSTVREITQGSNFVVSRKPAGQNVTDPCRFASAYGMGVNVSAECDLGVTAFHGGGYPGYGSYMLLLKDYGIGIFAFANRTYAGLSAPVFDAAAVFKQAGMLNMLKKRDPAATDALSTAYRAAGEIYAAGAVDAHRDVLAMNFLMDRSAENWKATLAELKGDLGDCDVSSPITATGALAGRFTWRCKTGRVDGTLLLAPTRAVGIQALRFTVVTP